MHESNAQSGDESNEQSGDEANAQGVEESNAESGAIFEKNLNYLLSSDEDEFISAFNDYDEIQQKKLIIQVLIKIEISVINGNVISFITWSKLIEFMKNDIKNKLNVYYKSTENPICKTNLIILSCKHKKLDILKILLDGSNVVLNVLYNNCANINPDTNDDECHNAFYYAIRSGKVNLLDTLIKKWPGNLFASRPEKLHKVLSNSYEELKLKNVLLSDTIMYYVEEKLIKLLTSQSYESPTQELITNKLEFFLKTINLLKSFTNRNDNDKFLFVIKYISQLIKLLKKHLRSTYNNLPWEEMEFCLICFAFTYSRDNKINLCYRSVLNKKQLLFHLENFAVKVREEIDYIKKTNTDVLLRWPNLKRDAIIVNNSDVFESLYTDYQIIRNNLTLINILCYIKLALAAKCTDKEGQLIIKITLLVIGIHLKNSLEFPKLSENISDHIILATSVETRNILLRLRNSVSHSFLDTIAEWEEKTDVTFYETIQNDMKNISVVIRNIILKMEINLIKTLSNKIVESSKTVNQIDLIEYFKIIDAKKLLNKVSDIIKMKEYEHMYEFIRKFSKILRDLTGYERKLFKEILSTIYMKRNSSNLFFDDESKYMREINSINKIYDEFDANMLITSKSIAKNIISDLDKITTNNTNDIKRIAEKLLKIVLSATPKIQLSQFNEIYLMFYQTFITYLFEDDRIEEMKALRKNLIKKSYVHPSFNHSEKCGKINENKMSHENINFLQNMLQNEFNQIFEYECTKEYPVIIEMLLLDILSMIERSDVSSVNKLLFHNDSFQLLLRKCLQNHTTHSNPLIDILFFDDPSVEILSKAEMFADLNIMSNIKKIDNFKDISILKNENSSLSTKINENLQLLSNQRILFLALANGNLEKLNESIKKGGDINARDIEMRTSLHYAAKGPSLEVLKFLLDHLENSEIKDIRNKSPLHVASFFGGINLVQYLMDETGFGVDDCNNVGETALHKATLGGNIEAVELLLNSEARVNSKTSDGNTPLHLAVTKNYQNIVDILIENGANIDCQSILGFTPLYLASKEGNTDMVNILLRNKANVYIKNYKGKTALHISSQKGHVDVIKTLISNESFVNMQDNKDNTALHKAVGGGHEDAVKILLNHDAVTDIGNQPLNMFPLHIAASNGYKKIAKMLIKYGANINCAAADSGVTALQFAVLAGNNDIVGLLLKNDANINQVNVWEESALHYCASLWNNKKMAEILISYGANIDKKNKYGETALHIGSRKGNVEFVEFLISKGADIAVTNIVGMTTLHVSVVWGHKDIIKIILLQEHINTHDNYVADIINIQDINKQTALCYAVKLNCKKVIDKLLYHGADVNIENGKALQLAVSWGYKETVTKFLKNDVSKMALSFSLFPAISKDKSIIEMLLCNGADANISIYRNYTPLHCAAFNGLNDIVKILINHKADVNAKTCKDSTSLHLAVSKSHLNVVKTLIRNKADVKAINNDSVTPLEVAVLACNLQIMQILLQHEDANINARGQNNSTLLHLSAYSGSLELIKYLINEGADMNAKSANGLKPIHMAAWKNHFEIIEYFLTKGQSVLDIDDNGMTLLHYASYNGNLELMKFLIKNKSDVNAVNKSNLRPIHLAIKHLHKDATELLLNIGSLFEMDENFKCLFSGDLFIARGNIINILTNTENLFKAVMSNNVLEVKDCIKKGALIDIKKGDHMTLLHEAARNGNKEIAEILLKNKANPNIIIEGKITPLHYASVFDQLNIVKILLANNAIYNNKDEKQNTPLNIANGEKIKQLLSLVSRLFLTIQKGSPQIINSLKKISDFGVINALLNARNEKNESLIDFAIDRKFVYLEELKKFVESFEINFGRICSKVEMESSTSTNASLTTIENNAAERLLELGN